MCGGTRSKTRSVSFTGDILYSRYIGNPPSITVETRQRFKGWRPMHRIFKTKAQAASAVEDLATCKDCEVKEES